MEAYNLKAVHIQDGEDINNWQKPQQGIEVSNKKNAIREALQSAKIDPLIEPPVNPVIAFIEDATFATMGNFSCITGKAKSKKTFLISMFIAAFLKGSLYLIRVIKFGNKKRIIWFDTEQSRFHVHKALRKALDLAEDSQLHNIEVYDLRPYTPQERQQMIDFVLMEDNVAKDISFVVIDGIRDLVTDINDPKQATDCVTWLMKVTELMELHICTVLHQNKGDNNARGHLGTEIVNKAESILSVQKESSNQNISIVNAEQCRDKEFKPFAFSISDNGLPYILEDYAPSKDGKQKKLMASEVAESTHREIMQAIFKNANEYNRADLVTNIKLKYQQYGIDFGDNKTREFLHHNLNLKVIKHNGQSGKNVKYTLNQ